MKLINTYMKGNTWSSIEHDYKPSFVLNKQYINVEDITEVKEIDDKSFVEVRTKFRPDAFVIGLLLGGIVITLILWLIFNNLFFDTYYVAREDIKNLIEE